MRTEFADIDNVRSDIIMKWARDQSNIISILPNVVKIQGNIVRLKFSRLFLFSFESDFSIEPTFVGSGLVEYKLRDNRENEIKIIVTVEPKKGVKVIISYSGEKEWIVSKGLKKILDEIVKGIINEVNKVKEIESEELHKSVENYSLILSKISLITKLIMKSKLVRTDEVFLKEGELLSFIEEVISEYSNYPMIYVSGSGDSTFRLLFVNGDLKGVYILKNEKESYNEEELNHLSGTFKIHVYVAISPRIAEVINS